MTRFWKNNRTDRPLDRTLLDVAGEFEESRVNRGDYLNWPLDRRVSVFLLELSVTYDRETFDALLELIDTAHNLERKEVARQAKEAASGSQDANL